jgi:hypothetical protein
MIDDQERKSESEFILLKIKVEELILSDCPEVSTSSIELSFQKHQG